MAKGPNLRFGGSARGGMSGAEDVGCSPGRLGAVVVGFSDEVLESSCMLFDPIVVARA